MPVVVSTLGDGTFSRVSASWAKRSLGVRTSVRTTGSPPKAPRLRYGVIRRVLRCSWPKPEILIYIYSRHWAETAATRKVGVASPRVYSGTPQYSDSRSSPFSPIRAPDGHTITRCIYISYILLAVCTTTLERWDMALGWGRGTWPLPAAVPGYQEMTTAFIYDILK